MTYIVLEIQKFTDGTIAVPPIATFESFFEAMSRYHSIMATAAISEVPVHSCVVLTETGQEIKMDSYNKADGQVE